MNARMFPPHPWERRYLVIMGAMRGMAGHDHCHDFISPICLQTNWE